VANLRPMLRTYWVVRAEGPVVQCGLHRRGDPTSYLNKSTEGALSIGPAGVQEDPVPNPWNNLRIWVDSAPANRYYIYNKVKEGAWNPHSA
jgi:hypothetical protein